MAYRLVRIRNCTKRLSVIPILYLVFLQMNVVDLGET